MKNIRLKNLLLATCCVVNVLCTQVQGVDNLEDGATAVRVKNRKRKEIGNQESSDIVDNNSQNNSNNRKFSKISDNALENENADSQAKQEPLGLANRNNNNTIIPIVDEPHEEDNEDNRLTKLHGRHAQESINFYSSLPVGFGSILHTDGQPKRIVAQNTVTQTRGNMTLTTQTTCSESGEELLTHCGWVDNDETLRSYKKFIVSIKLTNGIRKTEEVRVADDDSEPYKLLGITFNPSGEPKYNSERVPVEQKFTITKKFKPKIKRDHFQQIIDILPLSLRHLKFSPIRNGDKSIQIVRSTISYENEDHEGPEYSIEGILFQHHERRVKSRDTGVYRYLEIYINPEGAIDPRAISVENTLVRLETWKKTSGWINDDTQLKAYSRFAFGTSANVRKFEEDFEIYRSEGEPTFQTKGDPILAANGVPIEQRFIISDLFTRPDGTKYTRKQDVPLRLILRHNSFVHDKRKSNSFQKVKAFVKYDILEDGNEKEYLVNPALILSNIPYDWLISQEWTDDTERHISKEIKTISISPTGAITPDAIDDDDLIVESKQLKSEVHKRNMFGFGSTYTIPHSGNTYQ